MANKMLIDATHPEETRVVVLRGNRVEEFDFETAHRKQLRGNIYLAKVTRVEPSLQAAFVEYGGNRHGFLAFSEIHPDYYQIPVADRQALIAEEERAHRDAEEEIDRRASGGGRGRRPRREYGRRDQVRTQPLEAEGEQHEAPVEAAETADLHEAGETSADHPDTHQADAQPPEAGGDAAHEADAHREHEAHEPTATSDAPAAEAPHEPEHAEEAPVTSATSEAALQTAPEPSDHSPTTESPDLAPEAAANGGEEPNDGNVVEVVEPAAAENCDEEVVESVGGADAMEEVQERAARFRRNYKIQEVIKRRQIMLVQVVKEERGTKGAALTTYLSLAGRYSVLMPNTARGGGISRKITNAGDGKRLKVVAQDLEVQEGVGVILRTAGANRTKAEIKRAFEYLLRMWETVRDLTLKSTAPKLVYEEGALVKRSLRDLYRKDIDEVLVAGADALL